MWQSNETLGREYIQQAEVLEAELAELKKKRPRGQEERRRRKIRMIKLEGIIAELRSTGDYLIHYDDKEDVNDQTRADAGQEPAP